MSLPAPFDLPAWGDLLHASGHFAAGVALGLCNLYGLRWSVRRLVAGGRASVALALSAGRFLLLGGVLAAAGAAGALPLLATALGVRVARPLATRALRGGAS